MHDGKRVRVNDELYTAIQKEFEKFSHLDSNISLSQLRNAFADSSTAKELFAITVENILAGSAYTPVDISRIIDRLQWDFTQTLQFESLQSSIHPWDRHITFQDFTTVKNRFLLWEDKIKQLLREYKEYFFQWVLGTCPPHVNDALTAIAWFPQKAQPQEHLLDFIKRKYTPAAYDLVAQCMSADSASGYQIIVQAAMEAKTQLDVMLAIIKNGRSDHSNRMWKIWDFNAITTFEVKSAYRNSKKQLDLYAKKSVRTQKDQQTRMQQSAAPMISRHHFGTDFDLFAVGTAGPNGNVRFRPGKDLAPEYSFLSAIARYFGFSQPYTAKPYLGSARTPAANTCRLDSLNWLRIEDREGKYIAVPVTAAAKDIWGYQEECWHWSYYPVAHALLQTLMTPAVCIEAHKRMTRFWDAIQKQKTHIRFDHARKYWPDYVFNVHNMECDYNLKSLMT